MHGLMVIDKPEDWTSHDVVNKVRRFVGTRRVGHLGTLDPIATGVLPLLVGNATRLAQYFKRAEKTYEAVVRFGFSTDTFDRAGAATSPEVPVNLDRAILEAALEEFRGHIWQIPPDYSAKKIGGTAAYKLARKQLPVTIPPIEVDIFELTVLDVQSPYVTLRAHCSAGTYIRSIAHDLGVTLGYGAHLHQLRRTQSGDFRISQAITLARLEELASAGRVTEGLLPAAELLPEFPSVHVDDSTAAQIRNGREFHVSPFRVKNESRYVKALSDEGELLAIGEAILPNVYKPVVVFPLSVGEAELSA